MPLLISLSTALSDIFLQLATLGFVFCSGGNFYMKYMNWFRLGIIGEQKDVSDADQSLDKLSPGNFVFNFFQHPKNIT